MQNFISFNPIIGVHVARWICFFIDTLTHSGYGSIKTVSHQPNVIIISAHKVNDFGGNVKKKTEKRLMATKQQHHSHFSEYHAVAAVAKVSRSMRGGSCAERQQRYRLKQDAKSGRKQWRKNMTKISMQWTHTNGKQNWDKLFYGLAEKEFNRNGVVTVVHSAHSLSHRSSLAYGSAALHERENTHTNRRHSLTHIRLCIAINQNSIDSVSSQTHTMKLLSANERESENKFFI